MPIEDVQYLLENSVEDSVQLFVDSNNRNREFYPTPSEYVVEFEQPLRNVFGLEILDGSLPSSMYNVDTHANTIKTIVFETLQQPYVPPFTVRQFMKHAGEITRLREYIDRADPERVLLVTYEAYLDAVEVGGYVPAPCQTPVRVANFDCDNALLIRHVATRVRMERNRPGLRDDPAYYTFHYGGSAYHVRKDPAAQPNGADPFVQEALRVLRDESARFDFAVVCVIDGSPTYDPFFVEKPDDSSNDLYDLYWYAIVETDAASLDTYISDGHAYVYTMRNIVARLEPGQYTLSQFESRMQSLLSPYGFRQGPTGALPINQSYKINYTNDAEFVFDMQRSTLRTTLGFDQYANATTISDIGYINDPTTIEKAAVEYGDNPRMFKSVFNEGRGQYELATPGIINLLGERYVKLRCPEIEDYLNGIAGYTRYSTGLGIFKLVGSNEVTHVRFDFVSVKNRDIHPIGKLPRLTFRFERPDGELYDFKGVNHHILFNVKTWVPVPKLRFDGSVLNPEYDADFQRYQLQQDSTAADRERLELQQAEFAQRAGRAPPRVDDTQFDYSTDETDYSQHASTDGTYDDASPSTTTPSDPEDAVAAS